jgi:hypothetical protein
MTEPTRRTWLQIVRIPPEGVSDFCAYEDLVLPLLPEYDGRLDSRYRGSDGCFELHVVSFPSEADLDAFRRDPRRQSVQHLLRASGATTELIEAGSV